MYERERKERQRKRKQVRMTVLFCFACVVKKKSRESKCADVIGRGVFLVVEKGVGGSGGG